MNFFSWAVATEARRIRLAKPGVGGRFFRISPPESVGSILGVPPVEVATGPNRSRPGVELKTAGNTATTTLAEK
jgi:hypothetical protein